jgi:hypothetical protein
MVFFARPSFLTTRDPTAAPNGNLQLQAVDATAVSKELLEIRDVCHTAALSDLQFRAVGRFPRPHEKLASQAASELSTGARCGTVGLRS